MNMMRAGGVGPRDQRGIGLIEVMVAVAILAFGMLAIAALQATALRNSQSALSRSQAVMHTYAITDAMRANRDAAMLGAYNAGVFDDDGDVTSWSCNAPDPGSLALNDRISWITSVKQNLGQGACVAIDCNDVSCLVALQWNDSRGTGGDPNQTLATRTRL